MLRSFLFFLLFFLLPLALPLQLSQPFGFQFFLLRCFHFLFFGHFGLPFLPLTLFLLLLKLLSVLFIHIILYHRNILRGLRKDSEAETGPGGLLLLFRLFRLVSLSCFTRWRVRRLRLLGHLLLLFLLGLDLGRAFGLLLLIFGRLGHSCFSFRCLFLNLLLILGILLLFCLDCLFGSFGSIFIWFFDLWLHLLHSGFRLLLFFHHRHIFLSIIFILECCSGFLLCRRHFLRLLFQWVFLLNWQITRKCRGCFLAEYGWNFLRRHTRRRHGRLHFW